MSYRPTIFKPLDSPEVQGDAALPLTVIVPTVGKSAHVPRCYKMLRDNVPEGTRIIMVFNPVDPDDAATTLAAVRKAGAPEGGALDCVCLPGPAGFGGAFNAGVAHALQNGGLGRTVVCFNDDIEATDGWLESVDTTLHECDYINLISSIPGKDGARPRVPRSKWGRVGITGPVTSGAAGIQSVVTMREVYEKGGHDAFSAYWRQSAGSDIITASFLSGFCMVFHRDCIADLMMPCPVAGYGPFDTEQYPVAGYEDNDICVRARNAGWGLAVDWSCYVGHVGHATFDDAFPDWQRGMRNRQRFYDKWAPQTQREGQRLVGLYRVRIGSVHDLHLFRSSLERHASMLDGVAILLTNNPARDMPQYPDWNGGAGLAQLGRVEPILHQMLTDAVGEGEDWRSADDIPKIEAVLRMYVSGVLTKAPGSRFSKETLADTLKVDVWTYDFNERDERNHSIQMAYTMQPDWLLSIDSDEAIEDRVRRGHFERLMTHPDPGVEAYDFGWMDHWNDSQHYRTDFPWGDGGSFTDGRHGRRLWRAHPDGATHDRILQGTENGLHCGNIPDSGPMGHRVAGMRWRHFGYVRPLDRHVRMERYQQIDPNPDPNLIGGQSYRHIVSAEGMRIERFDAHNGIALHMLVYSGTDPGRVAGLLDRLYSIVDHIVVVWTDDEDPIETASPELLRYLALYKADLIHARLRDEHGVNFAAVRNAAIDHIAKVNEDSNLGLGWGLFFDPDEHFDKEAELGLRRMAQASETFGWLFKFSNPLRTGQNTPSDSVRMHRLHPVMRMQNRVHESFDAATRHLTRSGYGPVMRVCKRFSFYNGGLSDTAIVNRKLAMYAEGLVAELRENPHNGGAWHSLGLQLEAEGRLEDAQRCYIYSCQTAPDSYIGYRAMANVKMREALAFMDQSMQNLSKAHPWYSIGSQIHGFLSKASVSADNPATEPVLTGLVLPDPPSFAEPAREPEQDQPPASDTREDDTPPERP